MYGLGAPPVSVGIAHWPASRTGRLALVGITVWSAIDGRHRCLVGGASVLRRLTRLNGWSQRVRGSSWREWLGPVVSGLRANAAYGPTPHLLATLEHERQQPAASARLLGARENRLVRRAQSAHCAFAPCEPNRDPRGPASTVWVETGAVGRGRLA